jgi:hypothetical protein
MIVSGQVRHILTAQVSVDSHYDQPLVCPPSRLDFARALCMLAQYYLCSLIERYVELQRHLLCMAQMWGNGLFGYTRNFQVIIHRNRRIGPSYR